MTTPRTPRHGKALALVLGLPLVLASVFALAQCDSDGVTPVCPGDGGDCITPPGTSSASVVPGAAGAATTGSGGSAGSGGSGGATSETGGGGSGGTVLDAGVSSLVDAALDIKLGQ